VLVSTLAQTAFLLALPLYLARLRIATPLAGILERAYRLAGSQRAPLLTRYIVSQLTRDYTLDISRAQTPSVTRRHSPTATVRSNRASQLRTGRGVGNFQSHVWTLKAGPA
jgi:hypothetical protein